MTDLALEVFQLYANLPTEEARQPWDLIVKEQTESTPFHDIFGVERKKSPGKTSKSFRRCQLLRLQSCFAHDVGANLKFYISNCLKKPNKVRWWDQYHLLEKCYPEGVTPLLLILEQIEVAHPVDERQSSSKPAKAQGAEQPSKKFALGARIPKKPKQSRTEYAHRQELQAVQKHGSVHTTHNTAECRHYNKDGTPTQGTFGQAARKSREDSCPKKSYTQVLARMEKLEKSLKKANKKGKRRCRCEERDSNSNSS
eukprot:CCRYP_007725-RA/>CCRYP_007725-RA protein AED:0.19 eAED:0.50 QI:0/0/0/1/1/1/2/0/254